MADLEAVLDAAGLTNPQVREFVKEYAELTGAERVEVVNASDDARLLEEAVAAGELQRAGEGRYYSRSYHKDTARSEERTIVATNDEKDKGVYNNWRPASEMKPMLHDRMRGASAGKTMYVIPYLMAPAGNALEPWAAGVELTDTRTVVLHMIRMARVGVQFVNDLEDPGSFVRAVHVTGDLENLGQGTPDDQRYFVTVADERTILHFGSSYGGNALLGKIAHGLRQGAYDGWASKKFLAEQYMLIGIHDKETGKTLPHLRRLPERLRQDQPGHDGGPRRARRPLPRLVLRRRHRVAVGRRGVGSPDGMNPEYGVFGVAKDTNETTNPNALPPSTRAPKAIFTNVAYNPTTGEVWWEGKTPKPPRTCTAGSTGWARRSPTARSDDTAPWAHPNSRFTTTLANVPNIAPDYDEPLGVPIDAIIFGGRTRDREPLIRAITDLAEGVYDGLTLGAEATFAAEGKEGMLRYDPMSNRPFMAYGEGDYARHYLDIVGAAKDQPIFAHVNWFQTRRRGRPLPLARLPRQPAPAALAAPAQERRGRGTAYGRRHHPDQGGARPRRAWTSRAEDLERILSHRQGALAAGDGLPRGAPLPVRPDARGDLGGPPPGRRGSRRGGVRPDGVDTPSTTTDRVRRLVSGTAASASSTVDLRRGTPALAVPFAVVAVIGLVTVLLPPYERPWWVAGLAALSLVPVVRGVPREPAPGERSWLDPLAAYLLFPYAALLHDAAGAGAGGSSSGMTVLLLLPILWLAITGTLAPAVGGERPRRPHLRDPDRGDRAARPMPSGTGVGPSSGRPSPW